MRLIDKSTRVSRRTLLATGGAAAALVVSGGALFCPSESWAMELKNLKPETMRTLIKMARDIYPHDRLADRYYAVAMKGYDDQAADATMKATIEAGVAKLDAAAMAKHGVGFADVGWEIDRVALLRDMQSDGFFQGVRGGLVTGIYNNQEVWPLFGYEGESASKGGYIERGFGDIDWL